MSTRWRNDALVPPAAGVLGFDCSVTPCSDAQQILYYQVNTPAGIGQDMAIGSDDRPVFSHVGSDSDVLLFGRCQDADCSGNVDAVMVDDGDFALGFDDSTSIAVRPDARAVIAYQRLSASIPSFTTLYVVECADVNCNDFEKVLVERSGDGLVTGVDADLAIDDDGAVVIAYFDQSALDIKLARCNHETCEGPGDRLFDDGFDAP